MSQRMRWTILGMVLVVLAALGGWEVKQRAAGLQDVIDVSGVDPLQTAFNDDVGTPRLILLLSPT